MVHSVSNRCPKQVPAITFFPKTVTGDPKAAQNIVFTEGSELIHLKSRQEIEILRESNLIVHEVLTTLKSMCQPGITTLELDRVAEDMTRKHQGSSGLQGISWFPGDTVYVDQ